MGAHAPRSVAPPSTRWGARGARAPVHMLHTHIRPPLVMPLGMPLVMPLVMPLGMPLGMPLVLPLGMSLVMPLVASTRWSTLYKQEHGPSSSDQRGW